MALDMQSPRGVARWVVLAAVAIGVVAGTVVWARSGSESTDDAQIDGRITPIAARVGGTVIGVGVSEHQFVEAGTVLVEIDPRDYQVALARAEAELADARANAAAAGANVPIATVSTTSDVRTAESTLADAEAAIAVAARQRDAAQAEHAAAEARLRERRAAATKADRDVERLKPLVAKEEIAQQQFDAAVATADAARAAVDAAAADVTAAISAVAVAEQRAVQAAAASSRAQAALAAAGTAPEQVRMTRARAVAAEARVKQAEAAVAQAQLALDRTVIKAPVAGLVGRKAVEVGQTLQPSQPVMALVSRDEVWVVANFKETQLADMRPGQTATIAVDALGGRDLTGTIEAVGAATGAKFSLLPPDNATGNYVKVVQRVPVKIQLAAGQDPEHRLRPGLSVYATVRTR
ncbi:MAG: efflux RND transporter periplasmic adaptor subunit [Vicinamibacterales bacterium]